MGIQLDVFDEHKECDDAQKLLGPNGINLNSHLDVFYAILQEVSNTPQELTFLSILQHFLRIDSKETLSDTIWDTAETLVHRATLIGNDEDAARLLKSSSVQKFPCLHCRVDGNTPNRKQSFGPSIINPPPPPPPPPCGPAAPVSI